MSDEIIDVNAEQVPDIPNEIQNEIVESGLSLEGAAAIAERREFLSSLPEYPKEWQQESTEIVDTNGFGSKVKVTASLKEKEMKKLIKKYKRYMKNNVITAKRLES